MKDNSLTPNHYSASGLQPLDVISAWELDFYLGNVIKYIGRFGKKGGRRRYHLQDLIKAVHYMQLKMAEYADTLELVEELQDWARAEDVLLSSMQEDLRKRRTRLERDKNAI